MRKVVSILTDITQQNMANLAAELGGHQITDDQGQILEGLTSAETPAVQETSTVTEPAPVEKPAETETPAPKADEEVEAELAADETGKRYVPESRFKEVYGKAKAAERELAQYKAQQLPVAQPAALPKQTKPETVDKTDALETELLFQTLPQFDPSSPDYSRTLDEMAFEVYKSNPGITKLAAGRKAIARAKELVKTSAAIKTEARLVKSLQSDQGITAAGGQRIESKPNLDNMSLKEMEAYLKANGQW